MDPDAQISTSGKDPMEGTISPWKVARRLPWRDSEKTTRGSGPGSGDDVETPSAWWGGSKSANQSMTRGSDSRGVASKSPDRVRLRHVAQI